MEDVDAGRVLERRACNDAGCISAGIGQLAGIGLGVGDQLGDRCRRQGRGDQQHEGVAADPRERREVFHRVVGNCLVEAWRGRMRAVRAHEQRMAIRRGPRDLRGRDGSVCSSLVLDHDRLLECDAERLGNHASDRVGPAAGSERDDDVDRLRRIGLRAGQPRHRRQCGRTRCQMQKLTARKFHVAPRMVLPAKPISVLHASRVACRVLHRPRPGPANPWVGAAPEPLSPALAPAGGGT